MFNFEEALKHMSGQTVLCVGDLMLDDFVYGEVARISPEQWWRPWRSRRATWSRRW